MCECSPWIGPVIVGAFFGGPLLAGLILDRLTANAYQARWPTDGHPSRDPEDTGGAGEPRDGRHRSRPTVVARDASDAPTQPLPRNKDHVAGASPRSEEAMDLAEEHRRHLDRWWFDCDHDFHLQLTELLVAEPEQLDFLVRPQ